MSAMIAQKLLPAFEVKAKERQREHGGTAPGRKNTSGKNATSESRARDEAAASMQVNPRYVQDAKAIKARPIDREPRSYRSSREQAVLLGPALRRLENPDARRAPAMQKMRDPRGPRQHGAPSRAVPRQAARVMTQEAPQWA